MVFVADASVTLPWCFRDEATPWTESLLNRLDSGDMIEVPAHRIVEVADGLLMAERRKRIPPGRAASFLDQLALLPIVVRPPLTVTQTKETLTLAEHHRLTFYDACYLHLASTRSLSLATLDSELLRASATDGVQLLSQNLTCSL